MGSFDWAVEAFFGPAKAGAAAAAPDVATASSVFCAFDLETTGLDPRKEAIVEIGAIRFDQRGIIARFNVLVNPGFPMPEAASKVNGITDAMLAGKPSLDAVLDDFLRFVDGSILIAHNANFDLSFVNEALAVRFERASRASSADQLSLLDSGDAPEAAASGFRAPFRQLPNRTIDTIAFAKEAFPNRWKYSLQVLAKELGIEALEAHRAEDDARVCMDLFVLCARKLSGQEIPIAPLEARNPA